MGAVCHRGLGLAAHVLWRNARAGRTAVRRRDWPTARRCLATLRAIEAHAAAPSLRNAAAGAIAGLARAVSTPPSQESRP